MLTVVAIPKPFVGRIGDSQRNAVASWRALDQADVVLLGDEEGSREAAEALGVTHVSEIERGSSGTPRLDAAFAHGERIDSHGAICFVNSDIVLLPDVGAALQAVRAMSPRFLLVGQSRDLDVPAAAVGTEGWAEMLRARALEEGVLRGPAAIDYFIFTPRLFGDVPPFLIGRAGFDNWLLWRARSLGVPVVDATADVVAIHQSHDYGHLAGGKQEAYVGPEAAHNIELAGGRRHLYSMLDASHRLRGGRITRNPWATLRVGDRVRRARWKLGLDRAA